MTSSKASTPQTLTTRTHMETYPRNISKNCMTKPAIFNSIRLPRETKGEARARQLKNRREKRKSEVGLIQRPKIVRRV